jgi:hypothetical protein
LGGTTKKRGTSIHFFIGVIFGNSIFISKALLSEASEGSKEFCFCFLFVLFGDGFFSYPVWKMEKPLWRKADNGHCENILRNEKKSVEI